MCDFDRLIKQAQSGFIWWTCYCKPYIRIAIDKINVNIIIAASENFLLFFFTPILVTVRWQLLSLDMLSFEGQLVAVASYFWLNVKGRYVICIIVTCKATKKLICEGQVMLSHFGDIEAFLSSCLRSQTSRTYTLHVNVCRLPHPSEQLSPIML